MVATHTLVFTLASLVLNCMPLMAQAGLVQVPGLTLPREAAQRREQAKQMFVDSYNAYLTHARGHDNVKPVSGGFSDGRNGWGATIIDSMSTMSIMGLDAWFADAVQFASNVDFSQSKTGDEVSVFETTIRYLGGLLSAYELSNGQHPQLRDKAKFLADKLAHAWIGNNNVPYGHLNFATNTPKVAVTNIAEAGTLSLEWAALSKHTGEDRYRRLAENSLRHIAGVNAPLPGLPSQWIDPATGQPLGSYVTWGGGSDSYFEYLIKYARFNNTSDDLFADTWAKAVDSSIKHLLKKSTAGNWYYLADYDNEGRIRHVSSHLACFHGGNWIYGGKLMNNATIVKIGLDLADACWNTYASTATGIGPEQFAFISEDGSYRGSADPPSVSDQVSHAQHGFYTTSGYYILRPEVLESNFYAWRATGDTKYLDRAGRALDSFQKYLQVPGTKGYAGLVNVNDGRVGEGRVDDTESFWYAEVLKYLYLTFDDPSHISLDEYVFNTEAHPFKILPTPAGHTYGSQKIVTDNHPPFTPTKPTSPLPTISGIPAVPGLVTSLVDDLVNVVAGVLDALL